MAYLPCFVGPHTHRGRNVNVYLGLIGRTLSERKSGRFCSTHWGEIERRLTQFEVDPDSGALSDSTAEGICLSCLKPTDELCRQVFLTCYPAQNERKDYWTRVHDDCAVPLKLELKTTFRQ